MRIAFVVDKRDWAHHSTALAIVEALKDTFAIDILSTEDYSNPIALIENLSAYDAVHFGWRGYLFELFRSAVYYYSRRDDLLKNSWVQELMRLKVSVGISDHLYQDAVGMHFSKILLNDFVDGATTSSKRLHAFYERALTSLCPFKRVSSLVDLNHFKPRALTRRGEKIRFGWAGNSAWGKPKDDHKGLHTLITPAIQELKAEGLPVELIVRDRIDTLTPFEDMPEFYHSIDCYICMSLSEGSPRPVLEAAACGVPIISTDVGIVPELFSEAQNQLIVTERSVTALKDKICIALLDEPLMRRCREDNLVAVQNFSVESVQAHWRDYFTELSQIPKCKGESRLQVLEFFRQWAQSDLDRFDYVAGLNKN